MNDTEVTVLIFSILSIFICVPTFFLCNCNKNKYLRIKNYEEIPDDNSDIIQV